MASSGSSSTTRMRLKNWVEVAVLTLAPPRRGQPLNSNPGCRGCSTCSCWLRWRYRPREHELGALPNSFAVRTHTPSSELHQTPHNIQTQPGAEITAAATGVQPRELLEQPRAVGRPESHAAIPD